MSGTVCGRSILHRHHAAADAGRVFSLMQIKVREGDFIHLPGAVRRRRHSKLLASLIFCEDTGVPSVKAHSLIKFLVFGDDVIIAPNQVFPELGQELLVDGVLPAFQPRGEDVLSIDVLGSLRGGSVAAFRDSHDFPGNSKMLQDSVPQENPPLDHVHILHVLRDFLDVDIPRYCGDPVGTENTLELFQPFRSKTGTLLFCCARHGHDQIRRGVIVKESLLELRGVFVNLHFIRDGFRLSQASEERVQRIQVLHHKHVVYGHIQDVPACRADGIVRVPKVGRHLDPVRRHRPKLCRPPGRVPLHNKIPLAFQQEVNLLKPPNGRRRELVQRVRLLPEVQEAVFFQFVFFPVSVHNIELPGRKRQVGRNLFHYRKARAFGEGFHPFIGVALWRACPPWKHRGRVFADVLPARLVSPADKPRHSRYLPSFFS